MHATRCPDLAQGNRVEQADTGELDAMALTAITPLSLRDEVAEALADPGFTARTHERPELADGLRAAAAELARAAFDDDDEAAQDVAHRTLYALHDQSAWSPVDRPRFNQHDLTLQAVMLELEAGFERQLERMLPLPEDPPADPGDFAPWLADLALARALPGLEPSGLGAYVREHATLEQLREMVAAKSLFFLKEPDPWAMVIPSLRGEAKAGLLDLLLDEYGWGRYEHMHSTVYERLMDRLGLATDYDHYVDSTDWRYLRTLTYQGMLARHRRLCRRMYGYVYFVEADSPGSMEHYIAGFRRLGLDDEDVLRFYELHVTADEGHQQVALEELCVPVVAAEPAAAPEVARGVLEGRWLGTEYSRFLRERWESGRSALVEGASL